MKMGVHMRIDPLGLAENAFLMVSSNEKAGIVQPVAGSDYNISGVWNRAQRWQNEGRKRP